MKKFSSVLLYGFVRLLAFLPLSVLFFFSDVFLYPLVYYVARYRLRVVRGNIEACFPGLSEKERRHMERKFYRHFCDTFQETIKVLGMGEAEANKRMVYVNPEIVTAFARIGQGVLLVLGHYGNWEYQPFLFLKIKESCGQRAFNIYRPLNNQAFDNLYKRIRTHFGGANVTKNDTFRTVIRLRKEGVAGLFGLVSDQSPSRSNIHYWTTFLNQETTILTGPERMAKQTGFAVVYADVQKTSRGCYQTEFKVISADPKETAEFEITEQYARLMEKTILREPAYWLWTHRRWKHKHSVE
jgi:Kdo2-lipid IVA lauroyltransferase/acyltransferase